MDPPKLDRLLSVTQLAELLGVPVPTLYKWRSQGQGPASLKVGRYVRYRPADVQAWLDTLAKDSL